MIPTPAGTRNDSESDSSNSNQVRQHTAAQHVNAQSPGKPMQTGIRYDSESDSDDTDGTPTVEVLAEKLRTEKNEEEESSVSSEGSAFVRDLNQEYCEDLEDYVAALSHDADRKCEFPDCDNPDSELHNCQDCGTFKLHMECLQTYLGQKTTDRTSSDEMAMYCRACLCCEGSGCFNEEGAYLKSDEQNGISVCDNCDCKGHTKSCFVQKPDGRKLCFTCNANNLQNFPNPNVAKF